MREQDIQSEVLKLNSPPDLRLIRINSGSRSYRVKGAPAGTSDIIGWKKAAGNGWNVIALFVALEVKKPGEKPTAKQEEFLESVRDAGGIAGVVTSVEEARELLGIGPE
jgi:hypothetical protein